MDSRRLGETWLCFSSHDRTYKISMCPPCIFPDKFSLKFRLFKYVANTFSPSTCANGGTNIIFARILLGMSFTQGAREQQHAHSRTTLALSHIWTTQSLTLVALVPPESTIHQSQCECQYSPTETVQLSLMHALGEGRWSYQWNPGRLLNIG